MGSTRARWASHHAGAFALAEYERSVDTPSAAPACSTRSCGCDAKGSSHRMHPDKVRLPHETALRIRVQYERDLLHRSLSQRRALRHAYKVDAIRARKMARSLQNETLALRARRSSLQTALASKLVKATMQAERAACEDRKCVACATGCCPVHGSSLTVLVDGWQACHCCRHRGSVEDRPRSCCLQSGTVRARLPRAGSSPACPCLLLPFMRCGLPRRAV